MHKVELTTGIAKHTVLFYDSGKVMPMRRYQQFNKMMMLAMEVGSTIEDYDKRMYRANKYVSDKDHESASIELTNQRHCFHHALENYSPKGFALAIQVHSIDDKVYEHYDESTLNEVQDKLDSIGFTRQMLDETLDLLKKK